MELEVLAVEDGVATVKETIQKGYTVDEVQAKIDAAQARKTVLATTILEAQEEDAKQDLEITKWQAVLEQF